MLTMNDMNAIPQEILTFDEETGDWTLQVPDFVEIEEPEAPTPEIPVEEEGTTDETTDADQEAKDPQPEEVPDAEDQEEETPDINETPDVPDMTETPEIPDASETPETPEVPVLPEAPVLPPVPVQPSLPVIEEVVVVPEMNVKPQITVARPVSEKLQVTLESAKITWDQGLTIEKMKEEPEPALNLLFNGEESVIYDVNTPIAMATVDGEPAEVSGSHIHLGSSSQERTLQVVTHDGKILKETIPARSSFQLTSLWPLLLTPIMWFMRKRHV